MKKLKHIALLPFIILFAVVITGHAKASAADLQASVNHNIVQIGQEIEFSLTLNNQSASGQPNFDALKDDFDILSGASQRSSKNFINGSFSSSTSWTIVITPKDEGSIVIPPISYQGLQSEPIIIVVGKAATGVEPDVFFETNISANEVYVQALLRLDLKLYIKKSNLSNTQLDPLASPDAKIIQVGNDRQSEILKNGIPYFLVERSFFIFPEKSGTLRIPAIKFQGVISEGSRFSNYGKRRRVNASSEAKTIKVLGIPDSFPANATWLPAEQVLLKDTISPSMTANTGDPMTRTIITEAIGLNASALPPLEVNSSDGLKVYPDQGTSDEQLSLQTMTSTRTDSFALIANQVGTISLPEIKIPWWDTKQNKLRYASIESKSLNIIASSNSSNTQPSNTSIDKDAENKINLALSESQTSPTLQITQSPLSNKFYLFLIIIFIGIWLLTVMLFLLKIKKMQKLITNDHQTQQNVNDANSLKIKHIKKSIKTACDNSNLTKLRENLILWAKIQFPELNIYGLSSIASNLSDAELVDYLKSIDDKLYSNNSEQFAFDSFYKIFESNSKNIEKKELSKQSAKGKSLESLYHSG